MKRILALPSQRLTSTGGFTLIELMVTLTVAAVIVGIAAPNMRSFILNNRISSTTNEIIRSIQTARTEATKRQQNVVVCFSANPGGGSSAACSTSNYVGWIVFEDTDKDFARATTEPLLESHTFESDKIKIVADSGKKISYDATGFRTVSSSNSSAIVVCDSRGNVNSSGGTTGSSVARGIVIAPTGRTRITNEITNSTTTGIAQLTASTGSC